MKNLIKASLLFLVLVMVVGCEKNQNTTTPTGNAMMGKKYSNIEVSIHHIPSSDAGNCEGWYLECTELEFEFLMKIESGLPDSLRELQHLNQINGTVDLEFNGRNFYCSQAYPTNNKRVTGNNGDTYPFEVQEVILSNVITTN